MNLTTFVSAAMILQNGQLLVSQRKNGLWEFPGGKIETGEDPRRTVERELKEELDLSVHAGPIFEVLHHHYPQRTVTMLLYLCELTEPYAPRLLDGPVDVQWVPLAELNPEVFLAADKPLMDYLRKNCDLVEQKAAALWQAHRPYEKGEKP